MLNLHRSYACVQLLFAISRPVCQRILPKSSVLPTLGVNLVYLAFATHFYWVLLFATLMDHFEPLVLFSSMTFLPSSFHLQSSRGYPFSSSNSPHSLSDCDFATTCTFYTTFNPCFHSSEQADENGLLPPILDTGATHCLLLLKWLTPDQAAFAKRIHLKVASGTSVRALLYNNLIFCKTVSRPLISVGQLKAMLDVSFVWSYSSPLLVACSGGLKYILAESAMVTICLSSLHKRRLSYLRLCTTLPPQAPCGMQLLGLNILATNFHFSIGLLLPSVLPPDHAEFTHDPQVMFSSMACDPSLEETPLLPSLQLFPLPSSSSSSCSRSFPAASCDALPSSSVISISKITIHQLRMRRWQERKDRITVLRIELWRMKVHQALGMMRRGEVTLTHLLRVTFAMRTWEYRQEDRKSKDKKARFASHTTSHTTELESVQSSVDILLQHKLPKARQRTNVVTQDYTPRGRLLGGYATRGEGVTMASYRFAEVVSAIHSIAATRPSGFADEPYLSAQLNPALSLPIHKDKTISPWHGPLL